MKRKLICFMIISCWCCFFFVNERTESMQCIFCPVITNILSWIKFYLFAKLLRVVWNMWIDVTQIRRFCVFLCLFVCYVNWIRCNIGINLYVSYVVHWIHRWRFFVWGGGNFDRWYAWSTSSCWFYSPNLWDRINILNYRVVQLVAFAYAH